MADVGAVENEEEQQGVTEEAKETAAEVANQIAQEKSDAVIAENLSINKIAEDIVHRIGEDDDKSTVAEMTAIAEDEIQDAEENADSNKSGNADSSKAATKSEVAAYHDDGQTHAAEDALGIISANGDFFFRESADGLKRMEYWHEENAALQLDSAVQVDAYEIDIDIDGDGKMERMSLMDAVAASNDGILDLYLNEQFQKVLADMATENWDDIMSPRGIRELALKGIRIEAIDNLETGTRAYSLSLVELPDDVRELLQKPESELTDAELQKIIDAVYDPDAKVLKGPDGKLGSCLIADNTTADGYVQPTEANLASELDLMGYDCLSKADFIGHEDEYWALMAQIENGVMNGSYEAGQALSELYGCTYNNGDARTYDGRLSGGAYGSYGSSSDGSYDFLRNFDKLNQQLEQNTNYKNYVEQIVQQQINDYKDQYGKEPTAAMISQFRSSAEQQAAIMYS